MTISKDMVIGDLIALDQNFAAILMASGMGCVGCPSAQKLLEEAAFKISRNERGRSACKIE